MPKPHDYGNDETERLLKKLEKRLTREYSVAVRDVKAKYKDYMRRFAIKDDIKREAVAAGVLSNHDYIEWRKAQILAGDRWQAMLDDLAQDLVNVNKIAISTARGYQADAYAINHNFATYVIEQQAKINTSYTLFDRQTVERLVRDNPKLLPSPSPTGKTARKLAENKDLRWNKQKLSSAILQGVLQGESVPQMAKRVESVGQMDHNAAIRNARTMVTGAQNAGRIDAAKRAKNMGIGLTNVWMATLDMRTRHEHRILDGQRREVDEPFEVNGETIRFPGDPEAPARLVYNCRCTLIPQVKGFEYDIRGGGEVDYSDIGGMSYDEWKQSKVEIPNRITLPEEKAAAIRGSYINEYRKLREGTLANSGENDIIDLEKTKIAQAFALGGTSQQIVTTVVANHDEFRYISPVAFKRFLEGIGYSVVPLSRGSLSGLPFENGGGYKTIFGGDGIFQYHPKAQSHHGGAYWKIKNGREEHRYGMDGSEK